VAQLPALWQSGRQPHRSDCAGTKLAADD